MTKLSILIPTLENRKFHLGNMVKNISAQINALENPDDCELLVYSDNREKTTGHKRNVLLGRAKGKFTVFVDDDDKLAVNYIQLILEAIDNNPDIDAIGIRGQYSEDGRKPSPFETSLKHNWELKDGWYLRTINHISPIKRIHALRVRFPDITIGEDYKYTMALKSLNILKKEVVIKQPIYFYNFVSNKQY